MDFTGVASFHSLYWCCNIILFRLVRRCCRIQSVTTSSLRSRRIVAFCAKLLPMIRSGVFVFGKMSAHGGSTVAKLRPWHWLCARCYACLFEAVGPVRATTIYFPLARGASGFFFKCFVCRHYFLLGIGKTRKATLIRTYFLLYIGLMYKSVQLHALNHKFPPRKHFGPLHVFGGPVGFLGGHWIF